MWMFQTEEQTKAMQEAQTKQFEALVKEAKRKQEARETWEKANPPCPHCGRRENLPFWLQYG